MTLSKARVAALVFMACAAGGADRADAQSMSPSNNEVLHYSAEWRFVRAGDIEVYNLSGRQTVMKLFSSGLVSRLFHVEDNYTLTRDEQGCNKSLIFKLQEGRRSREIQANFDKQRRKATFVERDLTRRHNDSKRERYPRLRLRPDRRAQTTAGELSEAGQFLDDSHLRR